MRSLQETGVAAFVAVVLISIAGCNSDTSTSPSTPAQESASGSSATSTQAAPDKTIAEYIEDNNIVETPVRRDDAETPTINLPAPPGWQNVGGRAPEGAYDAFAHSDPASAGDPARIIVYVVKLMGNVEAAKILEYAPAEIQKLPGYQGPRVGSPTRLGGFDATQIGGAYTKDGVKRAIGQMTAVVPARDALFVIQLNAESPGKPDLVQALTVATAVIAQQATITP